MICIYCGEETGDEFDEHEECVERSIEEATAEEDSPDD